MHADGIRYFLILTFILQLVECCPCYEKGSDDSSNKHLAPQSVLIGLQEEEVSPAESFMDLITSTWPYIISSIFVLLVFAYISGHTLLALAGMQFNNLLFLSLGYYIANSILSYFVMPKISPSQYRRGVVSFFFLFVIAIELAWFIYGFDYLSTVMDYFSLPLFQQRANIFIKSGTFSMLDLMVIYPIILKLGKESDIRKKVLHAFVPFAVPLFISLVFFQSYIWYIFAFVVPFFMIYMNWQFRKNKAQEVKKNKEALLRSPEAEVLMKKNLGVPALPDNELADKMMRLAFWRNALNRGPRGMDVMLGSNIDSFVVDRISSVMRAASQAMTAA